MGVCITVLFAIIGNARIAGFDIALTVIAPVCILLALMTKPRFKLPQIMLGVVIIAATFVLTVQTVNAEVLTGYVYWPVKACLVALFVTLFAHSIDGRQFTILFAFVLVLLLTSQQIDGRSFGLFGPNMLYRFYGILYFTAIYMLWARKGNIGWYITAIAISIFAIGRTGSVGGIFVLGAGSLLFIRPSLRYIPIFASMVFALYLVWPYIEDFNIVQRMLCKINLVWPHIEDFNIMQRVDCRTNLDNIGASSRVNGIISILDYPFSVFGNNYNAYANVWRENYPYPHNIFVELWAFFGVPGIMVAAIPIGALLVVRRQVLRRECTLFHFAFISIFLSANLSGDLSDNYGAIGLALGLLLLGLKRGSPQKL